MSLSRNQKITIGIGVFVAVLAGLNLFVGSGVLFNGNATISSSDLPKVVLAEGIAIILLVVVVSLQLIFSWLEPRHQRN